jgi:hypothetical protein
MPKLSLWQKNKNADYQFFDRTIREMFHVGATDMYVHKYLGTHEQGATGDPSQPNYTTNDVKNIQDVLFLENRDRKYDSDIYELRGAYTVSDIDFNLTQFGIMLENDAIVITFHINETLERLGRKLLAGDVLELPHLKDDWSLDTTQEFSLRRFYVIDDVANAAEGYSQTWYPHLYRVKAKPISDSQEFRDILKQPTGGKNKNGTNQTLQDLLSNFNQALDVNQAVVAKAEADAPLSGYDTRQFYVIPTVDDGVVSANTTFVAAGSGGKIIKVASTANVGRGMHVVAAGLAPNTLTVDEVVDGSTIKLSATATTLPANASFIRFVTYTDGNSRDVLTAKSNGWTVGYLTGDGVPPNGYPTGMGVAFPLGPSEGDFYLRLDYYPNRLFRFNGANWMKIEDNVRMTLTNTDTRNTQKAGFINNTKVNTIGGKPVPERQSISQVLKPKADV